MPWSVRLEIVQQASNGLAYLHENSIVNYNIKSGNIFKGSGKGSHYIAKNGDFGKALFHIGQFLTQTTSVSCSQTHKDGEQNKVGTAPYTAPELIDIGAKKKPQERH